MNLPRKLARPFILAIAISTLFTAGCADFLSAQTLATDVVRFCTDGELVLSAIKSFVNTYFLGNPNAPVQAQVNASIDKCNQALDTALRLTNGVQDLSQEQVTGAFTEFQTAYSELLALVQPLGVKVSDLPSARFSSSHNTLTVPKPLAIK